MVESKKEKKELKSTLGVLSMIFGIVSIVNIWNPLLFLSLPAFVIGIIALVKVRKKQAAGKGMAIAGVATSSVVIAILIPVIIIAAILTANSDTKNNSPNRTENTSQNSGPTTSNETPKNTTPEKKTIGFDEEFTFDDLEIKILSDYSFSIIDNYFSDDDGKEVVKLPIYVKNLSDETHSLNMFNYNIYGPNGTQINTSNAYFMDDCIDYAGDLRSGASYTRYVYFLYEDNGTYAIEFSQLWGEKKTVEFEISK